MFSSLFLNQQLIKRSIEKKHLKEIINTKIKCKNENLLHCNCESSLSDRISSIQPNLYSAKLLYSVARVGDKLVSLDEREKILNYSNALLKSKVRILHI